MRAFLAHRDSAARASRRLRQAKEWVDKQSSAKIVYWEVRCVMKRGVQWTTPQKLGSMAACPLCIHTNINGNVKNG